MFWSVLILKKKKKNQYLSPLRKALRRYFPRQTGGFGSKLPHFIVLVIPLPTLGATPGPALYASAAVNEKKKKLNHCVTVLKGINKPRYAFTKLSTKSRWRRTRIVFALKHTFDLCEWGQGKGEGEL